MAGALDPVIVKDLSEAKAALARHGIVILRSIESELEPAIMMQVRDSIATSPANLARMKDKDLDEFMEELRTLAMRSAHELSSLYTRLLARLGTESLPDLVKELEGIGQLFTWERVQKTLDPINERLEQKGFRTARLPSPESVSQAFAMELETKWPEAFALFKSLAEEAAGRISEKDAHDEPTRAKKRRR